MYAYKMLYKVKYISINCKETHPASNLKMFGNM